MTEEELKSTIERLLTLVEDYGEAKVAYANKLREINSSEDDWYKHEGAYFAQREEMALVAAKDNLMAGILSTCQAISQKTLQELIRGYKLFS